MPNTYFQFKQFRIEQARSAMKVTTEGCILGAWASHKNPKRILDIGTGTGLLSLMLAQRYPEAVIDAVEVQEEAFEEAQSNFSASAWSDCLQVYHSRIQDFEPVESYDLIICNPPFFAASLKSENHSKNTAKHEGTLSQKELLEAVDILLKPDGVAQIIYPEPEMDSFIDLAEEADFFLSKKLVIRNKTNGPVFRMIGFFKRTEEVANEDELVIKEEGQYTSEFQKLLKDFYLQL